MTLTQSPANSKRLAGLDHLRALAIVLVYLCHYRAYARPDWVEVIGRFGWSGVDLFFVLSGFLIGRMLLKQVAQGAPIDLRAFYVGRFLRILPAYLLVVALYFAIPFVQERDGIAPLWKFLTFTQNFGLDFQYNGAFSHAWSLCIEEQFYLLLPLILTGLAFLKADNKGMYLVIGLFLLGFALRAYSWMEHVSVFYERNITDGRFAAYNKFVYYPTYNRLDGLLTGICIAALFTFRPALRDRVTRHGNLLLLAGLLLTAGAYYFSKNDRLDLQNSLFLFPLISIAYGLMVLGALSPSCILYRFHSRITTFIATLSYSIYLTHKLLNHLVHQALKGTAVSQHPAWMFWICATVAVLGGWALHTVVEKPFLRLRDRILSEPGLNGLPGKPVGSEQLTPASPGAVGSKLTASQPAAD